MEDKPYIILKSSGRKYSLPSVIRTDGTGEEILGIPSLEQLQKAVSGYIEIMGVPGIPGLVMVVNEEGRLRDIPLNPVASDIAGYPIVGNVVIMERRHAV